MPSLLIKVKVLTERKKEYFLEVKTHTYAIGVKEKAENNEANQKVLEILREHFPYARTVKLISGHQRPNKIFAVE